MADRIGILLALAGIFIFIWVYGSSYAHSESPAPKTYEQGIVDGRAAMILEQEAGERRLRDAGICGYAMNLCKAKER